MTNGSVLILHAVLGVVLFMHGYLAFAVIGPDAMAGYMLRMGSPAPVAVAWYLIVAHTIGGALIVVGLWTRLARLPQHPDHGVRGRPGA